MELTLIREGFYLVAGAEAQQAEDASRQRNVIASQNRPGNFGSGSVVYWQTHEGRQFRVAEVTSSIYGWYIRSASGLDGFSILASSRPGSELDGSFTAAAKWAEEWVSEDSAHRYAFARTYDLQQSGLI